MNLRRCLLGAAWAGLGGLALQAAGWAAGWAAEAPRPAAELAVVDVSKVFENYRKVYDVQRQMDSVFQPRRLALEEREKKLQAVAQKLEELRRSGGEAEELLDRVYAFQKEELLFRRAVDALNSDIAKRFRDEMREILAEIRAAIKAAADRGGYALVVRAPDAMDLAESPPAEPAKPVPDAAKLEEELRRFKQALQPRTSEEAVANFRRNPVLFAARTSDITEAVLKTLNDAYMERAGERPPAPPVKK